MNVKVLLPAGLFAIGAIAIVLTAACGGGGGSEESPTPASTSTATADRSTSAPATVTNTPSPIPTPTPYDGKVMRLRVPRLGIDGPIEELAINAAGELDTPSSGKELTHIGWYYIYDKPGHLNTASNHWVAWAGKPAVEGFYGNSVFSAHVYYNLGVPAPFQKLKQAVEGDEIVVTMEDGREYTYQVFSIEQYHRDTIPMGAIIAPPQKPDDEEWITLITCGGSLDASGVEYLSRDVVVARRKP